MGRALLAVAVLLTVAIGLAGCQSPSLREHGPNAPAFAPAHGAALSALEITQGARLYTLKCAKCHQFYDPADYSNQDWQSWMLKMSKKAHLKPDQEELLSRYLDAFRPKDDPLAP